MQRETEIRRAAFGLIPQLPKAHEDALGVLDFALAVVGIKSGLGREDRQLAADLVMHLPDDPEEARRALAFCRRQIQDALSPEAIAREVDGEHAAGMDRLRLV